MTEQIEKLLISDEQNQLDLGDYGGEFTNYSGSSYICDAISEIADSNTSIYYSDIYEFMKVHVEYVERAIDEFGWDGCGSSLSKASQMGEYLKIQEDLYEHMDDAMQNYCYNFILNELNIEEITEEQNDEISNFCCKVDNNEKFDTFEDFCKELFNTEEETEEV